ncbi:MAG: outer membrane protein assembly factor BamB family protein [Verrucomicrobiia bacterium]|jgi:outer membrane protein assembly factor BamB
MKRLILAFIVLAASSSPTPAEDWPQFRGINSSGISTSKNLPFKFSHEEKVLWRAKIGDGIGSAVIAGDRVFNSAMTGEQTFGVICHDAKSGKELWRKEFPTGKLPRITPPNSHASSTPATDGKRVYVYFSTLGIVALDAQTGKKVWQHKVPMPAYLMDWGPGASPVIHKDKVFFCQDDDLTSFVVGLDAVSGRQLWRTSREDMLAGYSIPVICTVDGQTDLVVAGSGKLKGYDPKTGKERWTCNTLLRTIMTSPVVVGEKIYIAVQSYGDRSRTLKYALMQWLDTNQDGILAREETPKEFHAKFDRSDRNRDQRLDQDEIETAFQHPDNMVGGGSIVQAVRGGGKGDVSKTHVVWNLDHRAPSNLSSPLVFNNRVYLVKSGGMSSCFDAGSGETQWELMRLRTYGDYYASPIAADGKVFLTGRNGFVVVLQDGPELKILAKNDMDEEILATPSIADGRLFIRTRESIVCISNEAK